MSIATKAKVSTGISKDKVASYPKYEEFVVPGKPQTQVEYYGNPDNSLVNKISRGVYAESLTGAQREKLESVRYDYMPSRIVNEAYGRVAEFGAKKYAADNWMKGLPQSQIASSLQRHLWAYFEGQSVDKESGLSHLDHVLWNAVALVYGEQNNLCDDRFENRLFAGNLEKS